MRSELYHYLRQALSVTNPYPFLDYSIRAQLNADQSISFTIHPTGFHCLSKDFRMELPEAPEIDRVALQKTLREKWGVNDKSQPSVAYDTHKCVVYWYRDTDEEQELSRQKHRKLLSEIPNVRVTDSPPEYEWEASQCVGGVHCYIVEPTFPDGYWDIIRECSGEHS